MLTEWVFIASLSHSGSTLLELLLGCHPQIISLGEVYYSIKRLHELQSELKNVCTCGEEISDCPIWGPLKEHLDKRSGYTTTQACGVLTDIVKESYGREIIIADSSKTIEAMRFMHDRHQESIRVLFMLKDIRNFVLSQNKKAKKRGRKVGRYFLPLTLYNTLSWYYGNKRIMNYLSRTSLDYFQFGYEELCLMPEMILERICQFIGVEYNGAMLVPSNSRSHLIKGNRMRTDQAKLEKIVYDNRWFYSNKILLSNWLFSPFLDWNTRNVYLNINDSSPFC